jgi:beta-galactosidase
MAVPVNEAAIQADRRQFLLAGVGASAALLASAPGSAKADAVTAFGLGRRQSFDADWRFQLSDDAGLELAGLDDSGWRKVDLPHDWSIEDLPPGQGIVGPFDELATGGVATGFSVGGEGWYRKRFHLAPLPGGHAEIHFEGVYRNCDVWLNGHFLGNHPSGYMAFGYDLTPHIAASGENVIAVRVRNLGQSSRWYSGSGIYRHVWLDVFAQPARIARWGVGITTRRISGGTATIEISTQLDSAPPGLTLISSIKDWQGRVVWTEEAPALASQHQVASVAAPRLWSPDSPILHTLETELRNGAELVDRIVTPFGIRIITFDAAQGMAINGEPTKLRGGCIHHDNGLLGAASFDGAEARKVSLLKARGYNSVRPSHNPFSPAFLQACDALGLLVICEAFDVWRAPKLPQDYALDFDAHWKNDLTTMVLGARNHPSVIMWSIGNEIPKRNLPDGVATQWLLVNEVHRLDPSRPVTAAINDFTGRLVTPSSATARPGRADIPDEPSSIFLDVVGYNYKLDVYEHDHARFPQRIIYGAESFPKDMFAIWELTERSPWLLGDFVWTAMDYLGESGIGGSVQLDPKFANPMSSQPAWPEVVSSCGDIDLIGQQKAASRARDVLWGLSPLEIAVQTPVADGKIEMVRRWGWSDERPSWTWPGAEGKSLAVRIYTSGDRVELRLNGQIVANRPVLATDLKRVEIQVPYAPGTLEVIAFGGSKERARRTLQTAGAASAIRLSPEQVSGGAGIGDLRYIAIALVDTQGRPVSQVDQSVTLQLTGPATLSAFGSAVPNAAGSFQSNTARTWHGQALAILRGTGQPGRVRIEAHGEGLKPAATTLSFKRVR